MSQPTTEPPSTGTVVGTLWCTPVTEPGDGESTFTDGVVTPFCSGCKGCGSCKFCGTEDTDPGLG